MHDGHHHHHHDQTGVTTLEEARALLKYMADHNKHHTEELEELHDILEGEAHNLLHEAIDAYESANAKLDKVLEAVDNE